MIILYEDDNRIIVNSGANAKYSLTDAMSDIANHSKKGDILVLQLELQLEVVMKIIPFAKKHGLFMIFNPAPINKDLDVNVLRDVDLLIVNEIEAKMLANDTSSDEITIINKLKKLGAENVIVTLGAKGGIYTYKDEIHRYPAYNTVVKDTTGAGMLLLEALQLLLEKIKA